VLFYWVHTGDICTLRVTNHVNLIYIHNTQSEQHSIANITRAIHNSQINTYKCMIRNIQNGITTKGNKPYVFAHTLNSVKIIEAALCIDLLKLFILEKFYTTACCLLMPLKVAKNLLTCSFLFNVFSYCFIHIRGIHIHGIHILGPKYIAIFTIIVT
jgi:hypothetical protein